MTKIDEARAEVERTAIALAKARVDVGKAKDAYNAALKVLRSAKAEAPAPIAAAAPVVPAKPPKSKK